MIAYRRTAGMRSTAEAAAELPEAVREQRARHLRDFDRQKRLAQAEADVQAAEESLERARRVVVETAALEEAKARLAAIKTEQTG